MIRKLLPLVILLFGVFNTISAQRIIIEEKITEQDSEPLFGPNRKHFIHSFLNLGFIIGESEGEGSPIIYGRSMSYEFGSRYKRKLSKHLSLGIELSYLRQLYHIKQSDDKTFPDESINESQRLAIDNFALGYYHRFNFGRRGDYVGRFLDLGVNACWQFSKNVKTKNTINNLEIETIVSGYDFFEPFVYNAFARIGASIFVLKGTYRINDIFKSTSAYDEFPRFNIALEIGIHQM
ncbi:MAG: hypothetical protein ACOCWC_05080 [Bacteroidota bacterium]